MLLVLASRHDRSAVALVERWKHLEARLMTCRDLSRAGWRYYPGDPRSSRAVIGDEVVPFERITGVLTCVPSISETELAYIKEGDRSYVAAEMTAFLAAWLAEATFPVINRPTPNCLMGPGWSPTRWLVEAARAGLRVDRTKQAGEGSSIFSVTVAGDRCFGDVARPLTLQAKRLAEAAQVQTMTVAFGGPDGDAEFVKAWLGVNLYQTSVTDALLDCFPVLAGVPV